MILCKHCKYFGSYSGTCNHPKAIVSKSLIDGHISHTHCDFMRSDPNKCGIEGKLFEPKQNLLKRILSWMNLKKK